VDEGTAVKDTGTPATGITKGEHDVVVRRRRRNYTDGPVSKKKVADEPAVAELSVVDIVMDKIERGEL
jgi:hypothetical protein